MIDLLRAYKNYDPAAKSFLEVALLYPGPKALFFHRMAHFFYGIGFYFLARMISELSRWITLIEIHPGAKIGRRLVVDHGAGVVIRETTVIGNDCLIFHGVTLGGTKNDPEKRHPTIEDRAMVGAGAKVLGPITIGVGAKVGANSVVTKDVPEGKTAAGIPAKIL